jgi:hypothetical protein
MSLYSLETREQNPDMLLNGLTSIFRAGFCGPQILVRLGQRGSERGIFWAGAESLQLSTLPPDSVVSCSTDGHEIAYYIFGNPDRQMFVGPPHGPFKTFGVTGRITGTAFSPDNNMLYALLFQPSGETSLVRISVHELRTKTIANDLDAAPNWNTMAISPDGRSAFIALASAGAPDNASRHQPDANRWLAIYKVDLSTGARTPVVSTPGVDDHDPAIAAGNLYWASNAIRDSVAVVPTGGGD